MAKKSSGKSQHVVHHSGGWAVKGAGSRRATKVHTTQKAAIKQARKIAIKKGSELVIHGRNGNIREKNSYGNDPHPPKG